MAEGYTAYPSGRIYSGWRALWVCVCAEESAATCVSDCPLSLLGVGHVTLCLCLPSCRLAAGLIHLMETPKGRTDGPNLPSTIQWHELSICCLDWERQAPCSSLVLLAHQLVAGRRFPLLYMNARIFSSKISSLQL